MTKTIKCQVKFLKRCTMGDAWRDAIRWEMLLECFSRTSTEASQQATAMSNNNNSNSNSSNNNNNNSSNISNNSNNSNISNRNSNSQLLADVHGGLAAGYYHVIYC